MERGKNIFIMEYMKANIQMGKDMEKGKNIIQFILIKNLCMKVNI